MNSNVATNLDAKHSKWGHIRAREPRARVRIFLLASCLLAIWNSQLLALPSLDVCQTTAAHNGCPAAGPLIIAPAVQDDRTFFVGSFVVRWLGSDSAMARVTISHPQCPTAELFATLPGRSFLLAAAARADTFENRGSFLINDHVLSYCNSQAVENVALTDGAFVMQGHLSSRHFWRPACNGTFRLVLHEVAPGRLAIDIAVTKKGEDGKIPLNRIYLQYARDPDEHFFGFGTQYSYLDLAGKRVPILVSEQGVGRGAQPISLAARLTSGRGVAGDAFTTYAPTPHYLTSRMRSLFSLNTQYQIFDLSGARQVSYELFGAEASLQLLAAPDPLKLLELYTDYAGRMSPLPMWTDRGVIIGMQGGSTAVRRTLADLKRHHVPISAFWLQDWVGKRATNFGSQLWWNWQLDRHAYPDWEELTRELNEQGIQLLTYVNPFLTDTSSWPEAPSNLFAEARRLGYLIQEKSGAPYLIPNTSFSAGLIDLTNPAAVHWMGKLIADNMVALGVKGWMADFGEALPFDSRLQHGEPALLHNAYPELWAKLNRAVPALAGDSDDMLFFMRSGFTRSPQAARLFWLGDQLVSWDAHDGIKTAVIGLLSSGLSGFTLNHSDTGGYTTISSPLRNYHRSRELLQRWVEMNAFTAIMRTHEGNLPQANHQIWSDEQTLRHFAEFAQIYQALAPYRRSLMQDAYRRGIPLVRPLFLHYPNDPTTYGLPFQFMLGADFIIAPVLDPGREIVTCYLPAGHWRHLWSSETFAGPGSYEIPAPIGSPAVFLRSEAPAAAATARRLLEIHRSFHESEP